MKNSKPILALLLLQQGLPHQILGLVSKGFLIFKKEAEDLCKQTDSFSYREGENGTPEIFGTLNLTDDQGLYIDTYHIRVVCTSNYPLSFPFVFETAGRIPVNIDWHVFEDGHCCICSMPEEILICHKGITLPSFIKQQIKPYFFNQKHRELHGFFLKERSHGKIGNIEFFTDTFKTGNLILIANWLTYIKTSDEPGRTHACFCGSRIKYRKCHRDIYRLFKVLPAEILEGFKNYILSYYYRG